MEKDFAMSDAVLEHANITVNDVAKTADMLCELFDWKVRWKGEVGASIHGGLSWHVGAKNSYLALFSMGGTKKPTNSYVTPGGLNHIGIVVDDLDLVEKRVVAMGFTPTSHADYEPGRRFDFDDDDGIEFEVVSYR
jgi:catechol 2,3-dioxygenase-like lactoylglutathione lyase family enzyme